jgi:hypothetical protein
LSVVGLAFNILGVKGGAGQHEFLLENPEKQVPKIIMWNTAYQLGNVISVNMIKVSILLFIMRMHNSRTLAYIIWAVMVVMSLVNMITVAALATQCRPLRKLWIPTTPGSCYHKGELSGFGYGQGVVNILTDFFCTILPIFIMWKVRMPLRTKLVVWGLMSLGLMATASQIVRVILLDTLEAKYYSRKPDLSPLLALIPRQNGSLTRELDDILGIVISAVLDQNLGITAHIFRHYAQCSGYLQTVPNLMQTAVRHQLTVLSLMDAPAKSHREASGQSTANVILQLPTQLLSLVELWREAVMIVMCHCRI